VTRLHGALRRILRDLWDRQDLKATQVSVEILDRQELRDQQDRLVHRVVWAPRDRLERLVLKVPLDPLDLRERRARPVQGSRFVASWTLCTHFLLMQQRVTCSSQGAHLLSQDGLGG
jgi:hypothetical protein